MLKGYFPKSGRRGVARRVRGVSLIEVLVAILLSSIGLLALAGANVASIRYSKMSQYRGTATSLVADLSERIRANKAGLASYVMDDTNGKDFDQQKTDMATVVAAATSAGARNGTHDTSCETYANTCTAAQLAAYDLATWRLLVWDQLPEGAAIINIVNALGVAGCVANCVGANVWIAWRDPAVANADENSTDARNATKECSSDFSLGTDKSIRCSFFRINL